MKAGCGWKPGGGDSLPRVSILFVDWMYWNLDKLGVLGGSSNIRAMPSGLDCDLRERNLFE